MGSDITGLHHVGHVVRDMTEALALYRRLGFVVPPPGYPTMAPHGGAEPVPLGAANTHADFPRNFLELATHVREDSRIPEDAKLVPLVAPPDVLPVLLGRIGATSANLAVCLDRFEGVHILMFSSSDVDATAARLIGGEVRHGGVNTVQRPVKTDDGVRMEAVRYLEIDGARPGLEAEGRIGVVADLDPEIQGTRLLEHPNGAVSLLEAVLCVAADELAAVEARYAAYLDRTAEQDGVTRVFDLGAARLVLVTEGDLGSLLPGERPVALPALVAFTVGVRDEAPVERLLHEGGFPTRRAASGDLFVPSEAALGVAIAFRSVPQPS
ncbi:catechol 2,3-dioxygenase-like lactoylglutathione lyase family enzyme [Saccharothrix tamanrassetensis]|uniref:Catechol 2,3-dioxygenase-like lactoylglutathione lyase family enzyme n=1 Tax=Saccharothrix tamanrassetensis TaxID=1051531 RepID=A0A841CCY2_9PSEU|nr:VOC family protein [Saccharothrix tamanrassetensis]MBB5953616.1 catechol 2,3-dioxygenase-like lactoylglutathione lyase family enzyme [Saccharothrix tamanrassetensis]